jgi:hypothetical protein
MAEIQENQIKYRSVTIHTCCILLADGTRLALNGNELSDSGRLVRATGQNSGESAEVIPSLALRAKVPSFVRQLLACSGARPKTETYRGSATGFEITGLAHRKRTGRWPTALSGPVVEAPGETWRGVEMALVQGQRGLPKGSSLARVLKPLKEKSP